MKKLLLLGLFLGLFLSFQKGDGLVTDTIGTVLTDLLGMVLPPEGQNRLETLRMELDKMYKATQKMGGHEAQFSRINTDEINAVYLPNEPARWARDTVQSIPNNTQTAIVFDVEDFNESAFTWDAADGAKISAKGIVTPHHRFIISGHVIFAANSTGYRTIVFAAYDSSDVLIGGGTLVQLSAPSTAFAASFTEMTEVVKDFSYFTIEVIQTSGAALDLAFALVFVIRVY